jgi:hypothetical protein
MNFLTLRDSRDEGESAHHPTRCLHIFSCLGCLSPTCSGRGAGLNPRIRNHHCHTNSVRIASSLRADMIFGRDRCSRHTSCPLRQREQERRL